MGVSGMTSYWVVVSTIKDPEHSEVSEFMTGTLYGLWDSAHGVKLLGVRDTLVDGWPSIAATTIDPLGIQEADRFVVTKTTTVDCLCSYVGQRPKDADRFLDSLHLPTSLGSGDLTAPGARLKRFPLQDSGLSALFPRKPVAGKGKESGAPGIGPWVTFDSDYATREFMVEYRDLSPDANAEITTTPDYLGLMADGVGRDLGGNVIRTKVAPLGAESAGWFEVAMPGDVIARGAVEVRANRIICLIVVEPKTYEEGPIVDAFLHSLQFPSGSKDPELNTETQRRHRVDRERVPAVSVTSR